MHKIITAFFGVLVTAIAFFLSVAAAEAQAFATWISQTGNNADNCTSPATPCATFSGATGALAKTAAGGVLHVLPGDYATFRIDKAINIVADSGQASIAGSASTLGAFSAGISVETTSATDIVRVRGMAVVRHGSSSGGIMLQSAGILHVEDCTFVGSSNSFGIVFAPTGAGELHVSNSTMSDNGLAGAAGGGILVQPTGSGSANVTIENVLVENNRVGLFVNRSGTTGTITTTVRNSTISGNVSGIVANASGAVVRVSGSAISENTNGLLVFASGQIISHGLNVLAGNTTNGAFTSSLPPQ